MLHLTENREMLIRRASEQEAFARTVEHRQLYITNESAMIGNSSTLLRRNNSQPRNSQNSRLQAVLDKIGRVTGIDVFKSAGRLMTEIQSTVSTTGKSEVLGADITRN